MPLSSHCIKDSCNPYDLSLLMLTLITWRRDSLVSVRLLQCEVIIFPLNTQLSLKEVTRGIPLVRTGELCHTFLKRRWVYKYIIWKLGDSKFRRFKRLGVQEIFPLVSFLIYLIIFFRNNRHGYLLYTYLFYDMIDSITSGAIKEQGLFYSSS